MGKTGCIVQAIDLKKLITQHENKSVLSPNKSHEFHCNIHKNTTN